jgi:hypothetical protein
MRRGLGQGESGFVAVVSIERVVLLVLADVSLPAQVGLVDGGDEEVHFVRGFVLQMEVDSLLGSHLVLGVGLHLGVI